MDNNQANNQQQTPNKLVARDSTLSVNEEEKEYFVDQFEKNGLLSKAKIHYSAQSVNKIPDHFDAKNITFCDCCMFPKAEKGIIEPYSFCDDPKEFSTCGIGTYLYFYYFKYIIMCLFVLLIMAAIPSAYISQSYSNTLFTFCSDNAGLYTLCKYYENKKTASFADWLYQLSYQNAFNYKKIAYQISDQFDDVLDSYPTIIYDYTLLNFMTMIALYLINIFIGMSLRYSVKEADYGQITPSDFTLMISNVRGNFKDTEELINKDLEMKGLKPLTINLTFQLDQYFTHKNELNKLKKIFTEMKEKNLDRVKLGCFTKEMTKAEIISKMRALKEKIKTFLADIDKLENPELFNGVVFATFNTNKEYSQYHDLFPNSFFSLLSSNLYYYLVNYLCCCCYSEATKNYLKKRIKLKVEKAPEPQDTIWENLQYTDAQRFKRTLYVYFISILLIGVSFGIVLGLNYLQSRTNSELDDVRLRYGLSIAISVIISIINYFTFINSALVPLASNHINNKLEQKNTTLINNLFIIFLSNALVSPLMWLSNIWYFIRKSKQNSLCKKYKDDEPLPLTQKELNAIFEKPDMAIQYKYSYLAKTILICLFYMPLFPIGTGISIIGIILAYFVEKFNLINTYRRPEMLNSTICVFYVKFFKFFIFVYAIGNWFFLSEVYDKSPFKYIAIILFGVLSIFPLHSFLRCKFIQINEFDLIDKDYYEYYFDFLRDYERTNPITRKKGNRNYLEKMKEKDLISDEKFRELSLQLNEDNLNVIDAYYNSSTNKFSTTNFNHRKTSNYKHGNSSNINYQMIMVKNMVGIDLGTEPNQEDQQKNMKRSNAFYNFAENIATFYRIPSVPANQIVKNQSGEIPQNNIWEKINKKYSKNEIKTDFNKNEVLQNNFNNLEMTNIQLVPAAGEKIQNHTPSYFIHNEDQIFNVPMANTVLLNINQNQNIELNENYNHISLNDNQNIMYSNTINDNNQNTGYQHMNPGTYYNQ